MKVKDLIAELEAADPDAEVFVAYRSGDYWRTAVARPVRTAEDAFVAPSAYHGAGIYKVLDTDPDEAGCEDTARDGVILHAGREGEVQ